MAVNIRVNAATNVTPLDSDGIRLSALIQESGTLQTVKDLRVGSAFVGVFEFHEGAFELLEVVHGEPRPTYREPEIHSVVRRVLRTRLECHEYADDGSLVLAHPIWLYVRGQPYLKGCLAGISYNATDSDVDSALRIAKLIADLLSDRISAAYDVRVQRSNYQALERELSQGRQLMAVADNLGAGLVLVDREMRVVWHNSHVTRRRPAPVEGRDYCYQAFLDSETPCSFCPVRETIKTGACQTGYVSTQVGTGEVRHFKIITMPVFDDAGQVKEVLELVDDVTEICLAEPELARYKRLINNSSDLMVVINRHADILAINRRVTELLGYSNDEVFGKPARMFVPDSEMNLASNLLGQTCSVGMGMESLHLKTKDGSLIPTQAFVTRDPSSGVFEIVCRDMSERHRMEQEIRERSHQLEVQNEEVRSAMEQKTRFFRNVSHELRTPITSVIGFAELLLEDTDEPLSDRQRMALERVTGNAHKLLGLVNDLLDLSKLEANSMRVRLAEVRLDVLLDQVVSNMMPLARDKGLELSVRVEGDLPVVTTDEQRLGQILVNLISNAVKFTHEGCVTVSAAPNGKSVKIAVRDTGIGIPPEEQDRIFEEFYQATRLPSGSRGTGLGLSITQRLAALLGGEISVESEIGVGSTFTVALPLTTPARDK